MQIHRIARHEFAVAKREGEFRVVGFEGTEAISQPYRFEIDLVSDDPAISFNQVIDQPATLTMYRGDDPSEVNGIVVDFEQSHEAGGQSEFRYAYRAVLVPRLWRLSLSFQSRVFPNRSVPEIVTSILSDASVDVSNKLSRSYTPREYTTQYKETDLAFVQRLLEFEGIRYHFEHRGQREILVLSDGGSVGAIDGDPVVLYSHADGLRPEDSIETIRDFVARQRLVTQRTEHKDYDYRAPSSKLVNEDSVRASKSAGIYSDSMTHPATSNDAGEGAYDGQTLVKVRVEEIAATREVMTGTSDCLRFRSGLTFDLKDHYRSDLDQRYLLTHVRHRGSQPDAAEAMSVDESLSEYSNEFQCIPASVQYRPPRITPVPKLPGVLTAKVVSGGTYGAVDDKGRYLVHFPFDLDGHGTGKPVRLAQPYTGNDWGQHFPVHTGAEMVLACVDGNVDRIIGLTTVYNGDNGSPVTSENPAHSTLRTWGKNELTLDDTQGAELVFMHATKDHLCEVVDNQVNTVGTDRTQTVGQDETLTVDRDQKEEVKRDNELTVGRMQKIKVGADRTIDVGVNHNEKIGASMTLTVAAAASEKVGATKTVDVAAVYKTDVGGAYILSIGAVSSESVKGVKTTSAQLITSTSNSSYQVTAKADILWKADGPATLSSGAAVLIEADDNVSVKSKKKLNIEASDQITLKCGKAEIIMKKNGDISIKGNKIDAKASGKMTLKGSQIAEN